MNTDNEGRLPGDNHRYTGHFDCGIRIDGSLLKLALLVYTSISPDRRGQQVLNKTTS